MGVPLLLTWLRKRFADCFMPADSAITDYIRQSTDNLYIDLNSFLYQAATIITATHRSHRFPSVDEVEDVVLRKLFDLLDDLVLNLVQPKALVYIAVDGVSPLGKMSQQRARRRRGARKQPMSGSSSGPASSFHRHSSPSGNIGDLWDGNCISVGTRFMAKVTEALHFYAVSRAERINLKRLREEKARVEKAAIIEESKESAQPAEASAEEATASAAFPSINIVVDDVLRPGEGENKIAECIRRIRADPGYGPNTSHVICSSDTDVTVTSLILHEPRIHVLRYEPPVSLGGKPPMRPQQGPPSQQQHSHHHHHHHAHSSPPRSPYVQRGGRGGGPRRFDGHHPSHSPHLPYPAPRSNGPAPDAPSSSPPPKDSWLSTFFSIHVFRQRLREILLLAPESDATPMAAEEASKVFERSLHDVVFVLLLFGNDFLPTIGGSIQEGTLDALLSLLATDFVPRGRTLVDPNTNHIQYASARYLLSCLAELPHNKKNGGGRLHVHNGGGTEAMEWGFMETKNDEEKTRETAALAARQLRREKQHERMCYCYWTMLQWALQYSAGIVEHWGCYYPYGRAPPLSKLAAYCGVLSYDALGEIARRRLEVNASSGGHSAHGAAGSGGPLGEDEEEEDDGMDGLPASALHPNGCSTSAGGVVDAAERGKPTDVMVQLLILIPPRSAALLPTVFRHHYREVEEAVQAPVEQLNLVSIGAWCEEKKRSLSEEERTRFTAYQFFASDENLGSAAVPFPAHDIAFSAYWDPVETEKELAAQRAEKRAALSPISGSALSWTSPSSATTSNGVSLSGGGSGESGSTLATPHAAGLQSKAASFFSMGRKPALGIDSSSSATSAGSNNGAAGAAALLANLNLAASTPSPASPPVGDGPASPTEGSTADASPTASPATGNTTANSSNAPPPSEPSQPAAEKESRACQPVQLRHPKGDYVLWVASCDTLQDKLLIKALGVIHGNRFFAGSYAALVDHDAVLSRSSAPRQEVRLRFRMVVVPPITDSTYGAQLLPGYVEPAEVGMQARVLAARQAEADRADPWKQLDKVQTMRLARKRAHGEEEGDSEDDDVNGERSDERTAEDGETNGTPSTAMDIDVAATAAAPAAVDREAEELQRRKEEARRRLAALRAARQAAQQQE